MKILCVQYLRGIEFWPFPLTLHTLCCTIAYCSSDINEVCRQVTYSRIKSTSLALTELRSRVWSLGRDGKY